MKYSNFITIVRSGLWVESLVNHFWWSVSTSTDALDLVERFTSIVHHVVNKHHWPGYNSFKKCDHERLAKTDARNIKWMTQGSKAHEEFKTILNRYTLRNDLLQIHGAAHTTLLEVLVRSYARI